MPKTTYANCDCCGGALPASGDCGPASGLPSFDVFYDGSNPVDFEIVNPGEEKTLLILTAPGVTSLPIVWQAEYSNDTGSAAGRIFTGAYYVTGELIEALEDDTLMDWMCEGSVQFEGEITTSIEGCTVYQVKVATSTHTPCGVNARPICTPSKLNTTTVREIHRGAGWNTVESLTSLRLSSDSKGALGWSCDESQASPTVIRHRFIPHSGLGSDITVRMRHSNVSLPGCSRVFKIDCGGSIFPLQSGEFIEFTLSPGGSNVDVYISYAYLSPTLDCCAYEFWTLGGSINIDWEAE